MLSEERTRSRPELTRELFTDDFMYLFGHSLAIAPPLGKGGEFAFLLQPALFACPCPVSTQREKKSGKFEISWVRLPALPATGTLANVPYQLPPHKMPCYSIVVDDKRDRKRVARGIARRTFAFGVTSTLRTFVRFFHITQTPQSSHCNIMWHLWLSIDSMRRRSPS